MTFEDPWSALQPPANASTANMNPVGEESPWDFYWMLDFQRRRLLGLGHAKGIINKAQLPKLSGMSIELVDFADSEFLVFKLLESANREIFYRLCRDIIAATAEAPDERHAVGAAIARTWRWHYLLRGGADGKLNAERQKGLIGELRVLEDHIMPEMSMMAALETWTGPQGAPKDFEVGTVAIEAKARRGGSQPHVSISSADQLDSADFKHLYLHVIHLSRPGPGDSGFSLRTVVDRVRRRIEDSEIAALALLEERLGAVGYRDEDDYSEDLWFETGADLFEVRDAFPRLSSSELPAAISRVRYEVAISDCQPYAATDSDLADSISGAIRGN